MSDDDEAEGLRERLTKQGEDTLGKLAEDLMANPLVAGAIQRAFDAREKASSAQEAALGALMLPSAADIERLTRRVRSVSQRLEGIEDGIDRLDERLADTATASATEARLAAIEGHLAGLTKELAALHKALPGATKTVSQRQRAPQGLRLGRAGPAPSASARRAAEPLAGLHAAPRRRSAGARRREPKTSLTASRHATRIPRSSPTRSNVAASISTAIAPARARPRRAADRGRRRGRSTRPSRCARRRRRPLPAASPRARRRAPTRSCAPSARLAPSDASAASATTRSPSARSAASAPQVPTRIASVRPSSHSSSSTIAALGPPIPVLWIVSSSPSAAAPGVAPQAAVVVEHRRLAEQQLGELERATGVAGQQRAGRQRRGRVDVDGHRRGSYDRRMAKKKSASRADAVRDAVDQAFKAQLPRERISELLDEIGNTAGRLRGAVDELRPATEAEVKSLRADIQALSARVAALEAKPKPAPRRRASTTAAKPAKKTAAKPAAAPRTRKKPPAGDAPAS